MDPVARPTMKLSQAYRKRCPCGCSPGGPPMPAQQTQPSQPPAPDRQVQQPAVEPPAQPAGQKPPEAQPAAAQASQPPAPTPASQQRLATLQRKCDCSGNCYQTGHAYWGCPATMVVDTGKARMCPFFPELLHVCTVGVRKGLTTSVAPVGARKGPTTCHTHMSTFAAVGARRGLTTSGAHKGLCIPAYIWMSVCRLPRGTAPFASARSRTALAPATAALGAKPTTRARF